ncbi:apoptosis regulator BAX-like [Clupea harengus]|uniref:Apoptosis regulator BAX-like n=1 Tax=Clupea harengus TaxID=7950 RepID=A0A8M1KQ95_CLUHA|nr:apoptosis regulator BAX-like [Clupea harengus]
MACEANANDEQITEAIMMSVVKDELKEVPTEQVPTLPEPKHFNAKDQNLTSQLAQTIKIIGDDLVKHKPLNDTIDGFAKKILNNPQEQGAYQKLVTQLFADGNINWGRIVVLFYTVGKLAKKMLLAHLPETVTEMISWTLNYFKKNILGWVLKMGGWICSIASIACFRIESVPALNSPEHSSASAIGVTCFVGGIVLGGCIVLWLTGRTRH